MISFRRRRLVRLHLEKNAPSVEGVFAGFTAGHYRLLNATLLEQPGQTVPLTGEFWVPRERVLYAQTIG